MCGPAEFSVICEAAPDSTTVVRPVGELDLATAPKLRDALAATLGGNLVVELSGLSFIDASGLSVLIAAHNRAIANGHQMTLRAPRPQAMAALQLTGLDTVLTIEPTGDLAGDSA